MKEGRENTAQVNQVMGTEKPAGGQQGLPKGRQQQDALSKEAKIYLPRNDGRVAGLQSLEGSWGKMDTARPWSPPSRNIIEEGLARPYKQRSTGIIRVTPQSLQRKTAVTSTVTAVSQGYLQTPPAVKGNWGVHKDQITASEVLRPRLCPLHTWLVLL